MIRFVAHVTAHIFARSLLNVLSVPFISAQPLVCDAHQVRACAHNVCEPRADALHSSFWKAVELQRYRGHDARVA